jgi:hypothetical protein
MAHTMAHDGECPEGPSCGFLDGCLAPMYKVRVYDLAAIVVLF